MDFVFGLIVGGTLGMFFAILILGSTINNKGDDNK